MRIINFGQVVDLEDGRIGMGFQFTIVLPDGTRVAISTDEATIQQLTEIVTGGIVDEGVAPPPPEYGYDESPAHFTVQGEEPGNGEGVMGQIAEEPYEEQVGRGMVGGLGSPPVAPQPQPPQPRQPMIDEDGFARPPTAKTVPADEMGYPITAAQSQMPTQEELIEEEEDPGESV